MIQLRSLTPETFRQKRFSFRQFPEHLVTDPQNDSSGRCHTFSRRMVFVHNVFIDQEEISLTHPHGAILDQRGKFPLHNVDQFVKIMIMKRHRSDGFPNLLIDLIVTTQHILPFVCRIPVAQILFSTRSHPCSLLHSTLNIFHSPLSSVIL